MRADFGFPSQSEIEGIGIGRQSHGVLRQDNTDSEGGMKCMRNEEYHQGKDVLVV